VAEAPDLLIVGDSHTTALAQGCASLGLRPATLTISGTLWHSGHIGLGPEGRLVAKRPQQVRQIEVFSARAGAQDVFGLGLPVLMSAGYHLGRLVPPLGFLGHVPDEVGFKADSESLYVSHAFLSAYVRHWRVRIARMAKAIAARAPLVVVAPPEVSVRPGFLTVRGECTRLIRRMDVTVFEPLEHDPFAKMRPLPDRFLAEDRVHGNAAYGAQVIRAMATLGLLPESLAGRLPKLTVTSD
jgi:hypothetical protein